MSEGPTYRRLLRRAVAEERGDFMAEQYFKKLRTTWWRTLLWAFFAGLFLGILIERYGRE